MKKRTSSSLLIVLLLTGVILLFGVSIWAKASQSLRHSSEEYKTLKAYYAARSGGELILSSLSELSTIPLEENALTYDLDTDSSNGLLKDKLGNASFSVSLYREGSKVILNVTGIYDSQEVQLRIEKIGTKIYWKEE